MVISLNNATLVEDEKYNNSDIKKNSLTQTMIMTANCQHNSKGNNINVKWSSFPLTFDLLKLARSCELDMRYFLIELSLSAGPYWISKWIPFCIPWFEKNKKQFSLEKKAPLQFYSSICQQGIPGTLMKEMYDPLILRILNSFYL